MPDTPEVKKLDAILETQKDQAHIAIKIHDAIVAQTKLLTQPEKKDVEGEREKKDANRKFLDELKSIIGAAVGGAGKAGKGAGKMLAKFLKFGLTAIMLPFMTLIGAIAGVFSGIMATPEVKFLGGIIKTIGKTAVGFVKFMGSIAKWMLNLIPGGKWGTKIFGVFGKIGETMTGMLGRWGDKLAAILGFLKIPASLSPHLPSIPVMVSPILPNTPNIFVPHFPPGIRFNIHLAILPMNLTKPTAVLPIVLIIPPRNLTSGVAIIPLKTPAIAPIKVINGNIIAVRPNFKNLASILPAPLPALPAPPTAAPIMLFNSSKNFLLASFFSLSPSTSFFSGCVRSFVCATIASWIFIAI
jgi:hypothetical protein